MDHGFGRFLDSNIFKILLITFYVIKFSFVSAQDFSEYKFYDDRGNHIIFCSDKYLFFQIVQTTGLGDVCMAGYGSYRIKRNELRIKTIKYPDINLITKSTFKMDKSQPNGKFIFYIVDSNNNPLTGVNVFYKVKQGKMLGNQTDVKGELELRINELPIDSEIKVEFIGFHPLRIPINNLYGASFLIYLFQGNLSIVEHSRVYLNFTINGDELLVSFMNNNKINRLIKQY